MIMDSVHTELVWAEDEDGLGHLSRLVRPTYRGEETEPFAWWLSFEEAVRVSTTDVFPPEVVVRRTIW